MSYAVVVLPEVQHDADAIYRWIAERSAEGAESWYKKFLESVRGLESRADMCGLAPENEHVVPEIRQLLFRTRKGHRYRLLFTVDRGTIYVLHVRGPGQQLLGPGEIRES